MKREIIMVNAEDRYLHKKISSIIDNLSTLHRIADEIILAYSKCDLYTLLSVIPSGTSLTHYSKLSKDEFLNGVTSCMTVNHFFEGTLTSGYDVLHCAMNSIHSDSKSTTVQKEVFEEVGNSIVTFSKKIIDTYYEAKEAIQICKYNSIERCIELRGEDFENTKILISQFISFCEGEQTSYKCYKFLLRTKTLLKMQN